MKEVRFLAQHTKCTLSSLISNLSLVNTQCSDSWKLLDARHRGGGIPNTSETCIGLSMYDHIARSSDLASSFGSLHNHSRAFQGTHSPGILPDLPSTSRNSLNFLSDIRVLCECSIHYCDEQCKACHLPPWALQSGWRTSHWEKYSREGQLLFMPFRPC